MYKIGGEERRGEEEEKEKELTIIHGDPISPIF